MMRRCLRTNPRAAGSRRKLVVYISYNSIELPLVQTQVLPYVRELHRQAGYEFHLITFEPRPRSSSGRGVEPETLRLCGISRWTRLTYHSRPSLVASCWDILVGAVHLRRLIKAQGPVLIHARSHVPSMIAIIGAAGLDTPFLFDCRGLLADEYADAGHWDRDSWKYFLTKQAERLFFRRAPHIVVLTQRLRDLLEHGTSVPRVSPERITVIPCCVDLSRFPMLRSREAQAFTVCYLGAVGTWYKLPEMLDFAVEARRIIPEFRMLFVNRSEHALIKAEIQKRHLEDICSVRSATVEEVPVLLAGVTAGIAFISPSFSKQASSPTKQGEYLAAGLPVVANSGIGDSDQLLQGVGVLVPEFTPDAYRAAAHTLRSLVSTDSDLASACRLRARESLSLEMGASRYLSVYEDLIGSRPARDCST